MDEPAWPGEAIPGGPSAAPCGKRVTGKKQRSRLTSTAVRARRSRKTTTAGSDRAVLPSGLRSESCSDRPSKVARWLRPTIWHALAQVWLENRSPEQAGHLDALPANVR